jgi:hypothetical protein
MKGGWPSVIMIQRDASISKAGPSSPSATGRFGGSNLPIKLSILMKREAYVIPVAH